MFIDVIKTYLEALLNAELAEIFSAPLALFLALMLIFLVFSLFCGGGYKRVFIVTICVIVAVFAVYCIASNYGFVTLPLVMGG